VGLLLCVTVILLPLGIPVLALARRLMQLAGRLVVPRAARHPVEGLVDSGRHITRSARRSARRSVDASADAASDASTAISETLRPTWTTRVRRRLHLG
jgi:hypothetical protein